MWLGIGLGALLWDYPVCLAWPHHTAERPLMEVRLLFFLPVAVDLQ